MRVHWLQHVPFETLGCIAPWLVQRGLQPTLTRLHAGEALPTLDEFDWLIVMGGPMNVDEHAAHPWLVAEKALLRDTVAAGKRVLGICLGAQLLARALGAEVTPNPHAEIGWFDVSLTPAGRRHPWFRDLPDRFDAFHWHGDTYALPPGCERLAFSEACKQQAFAFGDCALGLQFHLETTTADAERWLAAAPPTPGPYVRNASQILSEPGRFEANNHWLASILERFQNGTCQGRQVSA